MNDITKSLNARFEAIKASRSPRTNPDLQVEEVKEGQFAHMSIEEMREELKKSGHDDSIES